MMDLSHSFGQRLAEVRNGLAQKEFARLVGVHFNTLAAYERGEGSPDLRFVTKISDYSGKPVSWLLGADQSGMQVQSQAALTSIELIPRYDVQASAGSGSLVVAEDVNEHFAVGRDWLRRNLPGWAPLNATVGVLDGSGDSMEPTIRDGDTLMVVRDVEWRIVERGGIFVFSLDDRLLLKRLQVMDNGDLRVISDNKAYEAFLIRFSEIPDRVIMHGQVFFTGGKPRSF